MRRTQDSGLIRQNRHAHHQLMNTPKANSNVPIALSHCDIKPLQHNADDNLPIS